MDLGIGGKTAIVCAAGTDLGEAAALALAREGVEVTNTEVDEAKAGEVGGRIQAATGGSVTTVVCDITTPDGRAAALAACPAPDILINHAPGPPMGDFRDWSHQQWLNAVEANMLTAIELIKATLDPMIERGFGRIVNITSQSVRAPMANLDLSNAARSGLTGFVAGVARHPRGADVTINNLLPGTFETAPLKAYIDNNARKEGIDAQTFTARLLGDNPLQRLGKPEEFGALCAFICSRQAGYINGQNILIDGGNFPGTL